MKKDMFFPEERKEKPKNVETFTVTVAQTIRVGHCTLEVARIPTQGKLFWVNSSNIDRSIFETPMDDEKQECTRQLILEAFVQVDKYPKVYGAPFYTLIPEKSWDGSKFVEELIEMARELGDHIADWVEQALEWAQRICNGESWESICNDAVATDWYKLVLWKNNYARVVGGNLNPVSYVLNRDYSSFIKIFCAVPLVVCYEQ